MRLDANKLSSAVRVALSLSMATAAGSVGSAYAQTAATNNTDQKSQSLETIVVTGSNIRRVDIETANPVVTVDHAQIEQSGKLTLGDILQDLPAVMGPQTNPQVNNGGGGGSSTAALRGLGARRTLVLVDGHRVNVTAFGGNVDINSIPINMIERVEVLTTGASSVYGSDAVAGVVNFITRQNYQGAEFSTDYGISDKDDGERKGYHFMFGQTTDKGSIVAGVDYNKQDAIVEGNRKFSSVASSLSSDHHGHPVGSAGGSATGQFGNITLPVALRGQFNCSGTTAVARTAGTDGSSLADYHCFGQADKYNYAAVNYAVTPQERTNVFVTGTYHLTDKVDAYMTAYHNKTSSAFDLAPDPVTTGGGVVVSAQNYYNPFGVEFSSTSGNTFGFRAIPLGLRGAQTGSNNDQFDAGFKGSFNIADRDWNWDFGFDYGHSSFTSTILGLEDNSVLNPAFGPSFLNPATGKVTCGQPGAIVDNCIAANPFNVNDPNTIQALKNSLINPLSTGYSQEKVARLDLNGGLFDLPAGTTQLAIGGSYRKEYIHGIADPDLQTQAASSYQCAAGSQCISSLQGGYNVKEAYAELFIPILKDVPFANALNVTLGDRWSKYSDFGSTNNAKISVEWRPIDDLLLRGNAAEIFRAPTTFEIFGGATSIADKLGNDPCNHYTGVGVAPGSGPALACAGVPTDGTFVNQDVAQNLQTALIGSGANFAGLPISAEHGRTFDFGFVYDPHWLPGFSVNVDVWRIYINDTIAALGVQSTLNLCYAGDLIFCPLIHRFTQGGSAGEIDPNTIDPTGNLGRTDTKGVDFGANYRLPETSFGKFAVGVNATYLAQYDNQSAPGTSANQVTHDAGKFLPFGSAGAAACPLPNGGICLFPRWRAQAHLNWSLGAFDASIRTRFIDKFSMGSADLTQGVTPAGPNLPGLVLHYGSTVYSDMTVGYNLEALNTRFDVGVDNIMDKQPPLLYANNTLNANSDPSDFDFVGRYYFARVTVKF